jgi:hypothetical protein
VFQVDSEIQKSNLSEIVLPAAYLHKSARFGQDMNQDAAGVVFDAFCLLLIQIKSLISEFSGQFISLKLQISRSLKAYL